MIQNFFQEIPLQKSSSVWTEPGQIRFFRHNFFQVTNDPKEGFRQIFENGKWYHGCLDPSQHDAWKRIFANWNARTRSGGRISEFSLGPAAEMFICLQGPRPDSILLP